MDSDSNPQVAVRKETIVELFRAIEYAERDLVALTRGQTTSPVALRLAMRLANAKGLLRELAPEACATASWYPA